MSAPPDPLVNPDLDTVTLEALHPTDTTTGDSQSQMADSSITKPLHVHDLPVEIVQNVLGHLPDVESVTNASMACWRWQTVLRMFEDRILKKVIFTEIGDLHPAAIEALRIPLNQDFTVPFKILYFAPAPWPFEPHPARDSLLARARVVREIQASKDGVVHDDDEKPEQFDPNEGPYTLKKALEIAQTHQAHSRLVDEYFRTEELGPLPIGYREESRRWFVISLWRIEAFGRLFGGHLWYERWHDSVCFKTLVDAYWESFTKHDVHRLLVAYVFLSSIAKTALRNNNGAGAMTATCVVHGTYDLGSCPHCRTTRGEIEGILATGLVGLIAFRNGVDVHRRSGPHPFFLFEHVRHVILQKN